MSTLYDNPKRSPYSLGDTEYARISRTSRARTWFDLLRNVAIFAMFAVLSYKWIAREHLTLDPIVKDFDWYSLEASDDIIWTPCGGQFKCARLNLPLDYFTLEGPKVQIALIKYPATDMKNYKGPILFNPGGPGGSGTTFIRGRGAMLAKIVGPEFDIIGFDPRGTGATTPLAQCFDTESQYNIWRLQEGPLLNTKDYSIPTARGRARTVSERCYSILAGTGKEDVNGTVAEWGPARFMSTPSVATDMLRITEKLGQEKLQYWGFSYGSVLGQYFAAMYPDKVGRLVIDGVYDAEDYLSTSWSSNLRDSEDVISSFYKFCFQAGPLKCPVYESSIDLIRGRVEKVLETLRKSPLPVPFAQNGPVLLTEKDARMILFSYMYTPLVVSELLANGLLAIETNNQTTLSSTANSLQCSCEGTAPWQGTTEATLAIACGDGDVVPDQPGDFETYFADLLLRSPNVAPIWAVLPLTCAQWRIRPKWRYTGPFSGNTSTPLLVVSPRYDPVCPLSDAQIVQKRYTGARLLVQNSYGHCSVSSPSVCTAKKVRAYFAEGKLPEEGTVCEVDQLPFAGDVGARRMSAEDQDLLAALKGLTDAVPRMGMI